LRYRKLGKTGLLVSEIGLGTAQLGGPSLIAGKYIGSPKIAKKEVFKILGIAYDAGVNFFDTSDKYGDGGAERLLGKAFSKNRDKVILATKCGITAKGDRCFRKQYIKSCLGRSLKNLKTDYVDVFQMNKPPMDIIKSGRIYEVFDELKNQGKIRFSGVSVGTEEEGARIVSDNKIDTLQVFYNLLHIRPNEFLLGKIFEAGIGLIIRSPLSGGVLTGKFNYNTKFSLTDDRALFLYGRILTNRIDAVNMIKEHFKLRDASDLLYLSLNYLLSNKKISTIIPGVSKAGQLYDILKLSNIKRFSENKNLKIENFIRDNYKG